MNATIESASVRIFSNESVENIDTLLSNYQFGEAETLIYSLIDQIKDSFDHIPVSFTIKIASVLRKYAQFPLLHIFTSTIIDKEMDNFEIIRQYAQSKIELGKITDAISILSKNRKRIEYEQSLQQNSTGTLLNDELSETVGLLGRAYKQLYINAQPNSEEERLYDLGKAIENYKFIYEKGIGDYLWHGVNYLALLTVDKRIREKSRTCISQQAEKVANDIFEKIEYRINQNVLTAWDYANLIELSLAKGKNKDAIMHTRSYIHFQNTSVFNIHSTIRQLKEIWFLDESSSPGSEILSLLTTKLAQTGGIKMSITSIPKAIQNLEKVWRTTQYQPISWMIDALKKSLCVARIGRNKYQGIGTGFLLDGSMIAPSLQDIPLLLTNAHVINESFLSKVFNEKGFKAYFPISITDHNEFIEVGIIKEIWKSPEHELDTALLLLEMPLKDRTPLKFVNTVSTTEDDRVNIIGYPFGENMKVSLQDNKVVALEEKTLLYRTPTDPGSSGSPVFDQEWNVVGLHSRSNNHYRANQGIRIDRIVDKIRQTFNN
jgi:hypothetical protein